jgi:hypothetical protein
MKQNTRVNVLGFDFAGNQTAEPATVLRWLRQNGPREALPGYHRVRFDADGGVLLVHENRLAAA